VKGFLQRRPIWLNRPLGLDAVRKFAEQMEYEMARFYRRAAQASDDTVIPLTPKSNVRSESGDPLDRAGKAILGLFHRAASDAEANDKHAVEMAHQLSAQLRAAEDRIREHELAEELVDVEDWFQQWRFRHMKTVERIIGNKPGTGGSSGVEYLKTALERSFFPELWEVRTFLDRPQK